MKHMNIDVDLLLGMLWDRQLDQLDARILHGISNGMTQRETARRLKVDEGTIRHRLKRIKDTLRRLHVGRERT